EYKSGVETRYIEAAIAGEMYRTILTGEFREKSLKNFTIKELLASKPNKNTSNSHSKEWNSLLSVMEQKNAAKNNQETVRTYFNIDQGGGSKVIVLDQILLSKVFSKVKRNHLAISEEEKQSDDKVKLRKDAYVFLSDIEERMESVAKAELELGREKLEKIFDAFGDDEIGEDELTELVDRAKRFFEEANKTQINVKECRLEGEKKLHTLAKAISDISSVLDENDPLTILMAFAGDPISTIKPLSEFIDSLKNEVQKAKNQIAIKKSGLMGFDGVEEGERYIEEKKNIVEYKEKLERMVNA
ncbi:MAG: ATP-binding protein, partial [Lachnoanaerobaculum saburreum]